MAFSIKAIKKYDGYVMVHIEDGRRNTDPSKINTVCLVGAAYEKMNKDDSFEDVISEIVDTDRKKKLPPAEARKAKAKAEESRA